MAAETVTEEAEGLTVRGCAGGVAGAVRRVDSEVAVWGRRGERRELPWRERRRVVVRTGACVSCEFERWRHSAAQAASARDQRRRRVRLFRGDPALGHPASRVRQWPPSAPAPVSVTIILDLCLAAFALLVVLAALPRWILVVPLVGWAVAITVYGRRAAKALGIRSRDETPRGWLTALALPGGLVGVLAANSGRSAGFVLMAYVLAAQAGERIVWRRFLSSRPASVQGRRSGLA